MSATYDDDDGDAVNISARVDRELLDDFDRALKQAQLDGVVPLDMSRAEALRRLMRLAIDDPSILTGVEEDD
ncbi:hypothetical protein SAMN04487947_0578 [Halogeometricum rufum]|uniref:Uncharacterized protein n=1 Tax=Halogeometricum rufum TaxID=553469 RepID=A0A1I6G4U5_9EURY|nr:hypothetical protein [Halogeometricum rufum]SFR37228.1 hypothetical protein SAMN04487947_0578 [Halogeometricum rufum]